MTIGPDPMTSTEFRSARLGMTESPQTENHEGTGSLVAAPAIRARGHHEEARSPPGHLAPSISWQNSPNNPDASCGPGAASGWYWTLNAGASSSRRPSTTPSLRLTWVISAGPKAVLNSAPGTVPAGSATAKPWLWLVI